MAFSQLNPTVPLRTAKGAGEAIAVIDYSSEHDLMWVVIMDHDGSVWTVPNADVRGFKNYSVGRNMDDKPTHWHMMDTFIRVHLANPEHVNRMLSACLCTEHYWQLFERLHAEHGGKLGHEL